MAKSLPQVGREVFGIMGSGPICRIFEVEFSFQEEFACENHGKLFVQRKPFVIMGFLQFGFLIPWDRSTASVCPARPRQPRLAGPGATG
jgi:hypothetical protein